MEIRLLGTCQPDPGEVLPPPCFSVVLPSSVLTYFEDWNCFDWILVAPSPVGIKIVPFVPVEGVPFIQRDQVVISAAFRKFELRSVSVF